MPSRSVGDVPSRLIRAVLLDIEGTTTPVTFVADVLFPYARKHLRRHLEQHIGSREHQILPDGPRDSGTRAGGPRDEPAASAEYAVLFDRLRDEHEADRRAGASPPAWDDATPDADSEQRTARLESVAAYCEWLIDREMNALRTGGPAPRKSTSLKTIQGHIWQEGYVRGELIGQVFDDVRPALERWHGRGLQVGIFSSGSVLAQRLLFEHSSAGDLTPFLQWYFDTTTGAKGDAGSYRRIAEAMNLTPDAIVFVSDIVKELDAAREAGMLTRLSLRPGNAPQAVGGHTEIHTFHELLS